MLINILFYELAIYENIYILGSLCFDFPVVQCSIHKSRAEYIKIGKANILHFCPDKPVSWLTHSSGILILFYNII